MWSFFTGCFVVEFWHVAFTFRMNFSLQIVLKSRENLSMYYRSYIVEWNSIVCGIAILCGKEDWKDFLGFFSCFSLKFIQVTMVVYNNFCFRNPAMVFWFGRSLSIIVYLGKIWYEYVILPKYIFFFEHWFIFLLIRILSCFKSVYDFFLSSL